MLELLQLFRYSRLMRQVFLIAFLFAVGVAQSVSAQSLPSCTTSLIGTYTDSDGVSQITDIDKDDDGLIEICDLEGLNEMRYVLDGSGYKTTEGATVITTGCSSTCTGFELTKSLDFMDNASYRTIANKTTWTTGLGWLPIGSGQSVMFIFNGNGYTISNLQINRPSRGDGVGFFLNFAGRIDNIRLKDVNVRSGSRNTGGLASQNFGNIRNAYVSGDVQRARHSVNDVGGLVGRNWGTIINSYMIGTVYGAVGVGGLAGRNDTRSRIINSFVSGNVTADRSVGGLVGYNRGMISNSYATGSVGTEATTDIGGFLGWAYSGSVNNSYSTAKLNGDSNRIGGLVGLYRSGSITTSYWDIQTSEQETSMGGTSKTTVELQSPTSAIGIYSSWLPMNWDFGSTVQYPILKYIKGDDTDNLACYEDLADKDKGLPECGTLLPNQGTFLRSLKFSVAGRDLLLSEDFASTTTNYVVAVPQSLMNSSLDITAIPYNRNRLSNFYYSIGSEQFDFASDNSAQVTLNGNTTLNIVIAEETTRTYSINFVLPPIQGEIGGMFVVDEGSKVNLTAENISGGTDIYGYLWTQVAGQPLTLSGTTSPTLSFEIPDDFIKSATSQTVMPTFNLRIRAQEIRQFNVADINLSRTITIRKINNEIPVLDLELTVDGSTFRFANFDAEMVTDSDGIGSFEYRWQARDPGSGWSDIVPVATSASYTVPLTDPDGRLYRVQLSYRDNQGYEIVRYSQAPEIRRDIDVDDDGLIEIYYLEHLDAIRYSLDGTHYATTVTSGINLGCKTGGCNGFELTRNLDFDDDASYISTANKVVWTSDRQTEGWPPIEGEFAADGSDRANIFCRTDSVNNIDDQCFSATLEGNGYTISNLHLRNWNDKPSDIGLFAHTGEGSIINNIGLLSVDSQHDRMTAHIGGLVGRSKSVITNAYVTGTFANGIRFSGGLVGVSNTTITNSYTYYDYKGNGSETPSQVGGLVSDNHGEISNSYARGMFPDVAGGNQSFYGALLRDNQGSISNSYASGRYGFLSARSGASAPNYWADPTSSTATAALKSPTAPGTNADDYYHGWDTNRWDFGTSAQFPALRYARACVDPQINAIKSATGQPICGTLLPNQGVGLRDLEMMTGVGLEVGLSPVFNDSERNYAAAFPSGEGNLVNLRLRAYNPDATITSVKQDGSEQSNLIPIGEDTVLLITVSEADASTTSYTIEFNNATIPPIVVFENGTTDTNSIVNEGDTITLSADLGGNSRNYRYQWQTEGVPLFASTTRVSPSFSVPTDYVASDTSTSTDVVIRLTLTDNESNLPFADISKTITIRKIDNGAATLSASLLENIPLTISVSTTGAEPDGAISLAYQWQRLDLGLDWQDIPNAINSTYTIPATNPGATRYRATVIYTDAQGYSFETLSNATSLDYRVDIDVDNDGLIEIYYLEHLNAIRHQINGTGYRASGSATRITAGCATGGCRGYELARDLDFLDDASYLNVANKTTWTTGSGWRAIVENTANNFGGGPETDYPVRIFEGNGHTIANLYSRRFGLFAILREAGRIYNVGLLDVKILGNVPTFPQLHRRADLVGMNFGVMVNSYVTGTLSATGSNAFRSVGGLVGAIADREIRLNPRRTASGEVHNSYVRTMIPPYTNDLFSGRAGIGLFVGINQANNDNGINNSYARNYEPGNYTGSMIGLQLGPLRYNYTTVENISAQGGSGQDNYLRIVSSSTRVELRLPTAPGTNAGEYYRDWSTDNWDFGTSAQYPILKYAKGPDTSYPACSETPPQTSIDQPQCRTWLPDQGLGLRNFRVLPADVRFSPVFGNDTDRYLIGAAPGSINLQLKAYNDDATIEVVKQGVTTATDYFSGKGSDGQSDPIPVSKEFVLLITVSEADATTTSYTVEVKPFVRISDIVISENGTTDTDSIVNEGSTVSLSAIINGGSGDLSYEWIQTLGKSLLSGTSTTTSPSFKIPDDFIASKTSLSTDIVIQLTLRDNVFNSTPVRISKTITVNKTDNGIPVITATFTQLGASLNVRATAMDTDGSRGGTFAYQWQRRDFNTDWQNILSAATTSYAASAGEPGGSLYRVQVTYTDDQGYESTYYTPVAVGLRADVDVDDDGLIEIYYLEHLDAIRHSLDGTFYATTTARTARVTQGCRSGGCNGYELARNLDFDDESSYISTTNKVIWTSDQQTEGWQPIGEEYSDTADMFCDSGNGNQCFSAIFEGNGYTISNLRLRNRNNRSSDIGLFANTAAGSAIHNVGLLNVDSRQISINRSASSYIGGLVGRSKSTMTNVYVDATFGGELKDSGSITSVNSGTITNSYAYYDYTGTTDLMQNVGGLAAHSYGNINNSYARGSLPVGDLSGSRIAYGSLVAYVQGDGSINNSYATGAYGFLGLPNTFDITPSNYWADPANSTAVMALKSPTAPGANSGDYYHDWDTERWDFGTSAQFPALRYAGACVDSNTAKADTGQPICGTLLPNQGLGLRDLEILAGDMALDLMPIFIASEADYIAGLPPNVENVHSRLRAYNGTATIEVLKRGETTNYFEDQGSDGQSTPISVDEDAILVITVTETNASTTSYTIGFELFPITAEIMVSENGTVDTDDVVNEGSTITLSVVIGGGTGSYGYEWLQTQGGSLLLNISTVTLLSFSIPDNFIASDTLSSTNVVIQLTLSDTESSSPLPVVLSKTITINKVDNETPALDFGITVNGFNLSFDETMITDSDGIGTFMYQWQGKDPGGDWLDINLETTTDYTVPATPGGRLYRMQVSYVDAQGYEKLRYIVAPELRPDIDLDDDGLIEIYYLEHLDAIRYSLNGTHYATTTAATGINLGCMSGGCNGYELARSLDFDDDASYISIANKALWISDRQTEGWQPIEGEVAPYSGTDYELFCRTDTDNDIDDRCFSATFEGNGYTISNLHLRNWDSRASDIGLFAQTGEGSAINNVGLLNVDSRQDTPGSTENVGGLVGRSKSVITNAYVNGTFAGDILRSGSLVGVNVSTITNSYVYYDYKSNRNDTPSRLGGLTAYNFGSINDSYARGTMPNVVNFFRHLYGSLVYVNSGGNIGNSYAVGTYGFLGDNASLPSTNYWANLSNTASIAALKSATAPGINADDYYHGWGTEHWDFGTSLQFPALKYTEACIDPQIDTVESDTGQPICGTLLLNQGVGLRGLEILNADEMLALVPAFEDSELNYIAGLPSGVENVSLKLRAYNVNATIEVVKQGESTDYFTDEGGNEQSEPIPVDEMTVLLIAVAEANVSTTSYTITFDNVSISDITVSENGTMDTDNIVDEGSTITLGAVPVGGSGNFSYEWTAKPLISSTSTVASPSFTIPDDFIASATSTSTDIAIQLTLRDNELDSPPAQINKTIAIRKINNATPVITETFTQNGFDLSVRPQVIDADGIGNFTYLWQARDPGGDWIEIDVRATNADYTVSESAPGGRIYRVQLSYVDSQGYGFVRYAQAPEVRRDIDVDDDGLIEIYYLEHLDAIRYSLDGTRYATTATAGTDLGCMSGGCNGYELARNLDFDDDASYISTANKVVWTSDRQTEGWPPIEGEVAADGGDRANIFCRTDSVNNIDDQCFSAILEGNGYTISNLHLRNWNDKPSDIGLFAHTGEGSIINNIGLRSVDGQHDRMTAYIGGLVGRSKSVITNAYVTGTFANGIRFSGGLVGVSNTTITNSYTYYDYKGNESETPSQVGGLVSDNHGEISNSYARGMFPDVAGGNQSFYGALVRDNQGRISNSYASGRYGFLSARSGASAPNYWADPTSSTATAALKSPTAPGTNADDYYHGWDTNRWDFGTSAQFPALRYARACVDRQINAVKSATGQPICGALLPDQGVGLRDLKIMTEEAALVPTFAASAATNRYLVNFSSEVEDIDLEFKAYSAAAMIDVVKRGMLTDTNYFSGTGSGQSGSIPIDEETVLDITVSEADVGVTSYTISFRKVAVTVAENGRADTDNIVNEGSTVTLGHDTGGSGDYRYQWQQTEGVPLLPSTTTILPSFSIPADYIASAIATNTDIVIRLTLTDNEFNSVFADITKTLTIRKIDNGNLTVDISALMVGEPLRVMGSTTRTDPDGAGRLIYQWQRLDLGADWEDIPGAVNSTYTIPVTNPGSTRYRARAVYIDAQGYSFDGSPSDSTLLGYRTDIDVDDDGLIEIYYLEHLNAIRYAFEGSGYKATRDATLITAGCPNAGCKGYELGVDLDFNDDASYLNIANKTTWTRGKGWTPIGAGVAEGLILVNGFSAILEGNGHTISNLYINDSQSVDKGLFRHIRSGAKIHNIGLLDVNIRGIPYLWQAGLVGIANGSIRNSYVTGTLSIGSKTGTHPTQIGGVAGTVSHSNSRQDFDNNYARVNISYVGPASDADIGNLSGEISGQHRITNSYARGYNPENFTGSMVGIRINSPVISNSYTTGIRISSNTSGTRSYARTTSTSTGSELKLPTAPGTNADDYYYNWSTDNWDFGTSEQYPILKYAKGTDTSNPACSDDPPETDTDQPQCGMWLPDQGVGLRNLEIVTENAGLGSVFGTSTPHYVIAYPADISDIDLELKAYNNDATIEIIKQGEDINYFEDKGSKGQSGPIPIDEDAVLVITVAEADNSTTSYTLGFEKIEISDITVSERAEDGTVDTDSVVDEGSTITLNAVIGSNSENYDYKWTQLQGRPLLVDTSTASPSFIIPDDFVASITMPSTDVVIQLTLSDGRFDAASASLIKTITINKINNDVSDIVATISTQSGFRLNVQATAVDADGDGKFTYQWQRRDINDVWMSIVPATTAGYTVAEGEPGGRLYRLELTYIDAQGYDTVVYVTIPEAEVRRDIDIDGDGLIEIYYLEHLDAIRHAIDGSGYKATEDGAKISTGCPNDGCKGYELARDLDFRADASYSDVMNRTKWTSGKGWQPIRGLSSRLEGNGHTIAHLYINDDDRSNKGLFDRIDGNQSGIYNIGLLDVDISGLSSRQGGLVAFSNANIGNSYVTGTLSPTVNSTSVGGLAGAAFNPSFNNYTRVNINYSNTEVGNLIGGNSSSIINSYARGYDAENFTDRMVGANYDAISNSYTTGIRITGGNVASVLSYARATSTSTGSELKSPIAPGTNSDDYYYNWSPEVWDFGTSEQYPILKYAEGRDENYPACSDDPPESDTDRPQCETWLPDQGIGLRNFEIVTENTELRPVFGTSTPRYVIFFADTSSIDLDLKAYNDDATIEVVKQRGDTDYFEDKGSEGQSDAIPVDGDTVLVITIAEADNSTTSYTIGFEKIEVADITVSEMTEDGTTDTDNIVDEGSTVTLAALIDDSGDYGYQWTQTGGRLLLSETSTASPSFTIPVDFVASETMPSTDIVIRLALMDRRFDSLSASLSRTITINKINNGVPVIATTLTQGNFDLEVEARIIETDIDGDGNFGYQWQGRDFNTNNWAAIPSATTAGYTVPVGAPGGRLYRVQLTYTDAQGYEVSEYLTADEIRRDVDTDDDGLIEIYYLEHLDAMRYDLDGTHYATMLGSDGINQGCRAGVCNGYELARSLDFDDDTSYISTSNKVLWTGDGAGWQPIGDLDEPFNARFTSADTLVISNLFINRPDEDYVGLFGVSNGQILGLALQDVNISGRFIVGGIASVSLGPSLISDTSVGGTVSGSDAWVGGLVGTHYGSIINSHARGEVIGNTSVGGLAGYALGPITNSYAHSNIRSQAYGGGLVGYHQGQQGISGITNSYAAGSVEGVFYVGGLVGYNDGGIITNAYALGDVVGGTNVGGLVGYSDSGETSATYALGNISGANNVGGLEGGQSGSSITNSYNAMQLGANLASSNWSTDNWDADGVNPPKLKYGGSEDGDDASQRKDRYGYTVCGGDNMPSCGNLIPGQPDRDDATVGKLLALSELTLSVGTLEPPFNPSVDEYEISDIFGDLAHTTVTAVANNMNATATIGLSSQTISMNSQASLRVQLAELMNDDVVITLTASGLTALGQTTKTYTITLPAQPDLTDDPLSPCSTADIDEDDDGLMELCDIEGLYAMRYPESLSRLCGENNNETCLGYELRRDLDFDADTSYRTAANKAIFSEGRGWHPIGTFEHPFDAMFNANNHTIANLRIDRAHRDYVGLFAHIGANAKLENIGLVDAYVRGRSVIGALVGDNTDGTIISSYTSNVATMTLVIGSGIRVGGLVGDHKGIIEHGSYTSGVVRGNRSVGGLVGYFRGPNSGENPLNYGIINSYAENAVHGRAFTGGLVGTNVNRIINSYAIGDVSSIFYAGGLVGFNGSTIENTYAIGDVDGWEIVGGLVADNRSPGTIANSYASGMVSGQRSVGELVGNNSGTIRHSYAVGNLDLVGLDLDGTTTNSTVVADLAELLTSISEWDTDAWDSEDGKYPALRYITSVGCERDLSCGQLLGGQYPQLASLTVAETSGDPLGDPEVSLLRINPLNYLLIVGDENTMVMLTPTANDNTTSLSYSIDEGNFTDIASGSPFMVSGAAETAIIRLIVPTDDPNFAYIRSVDYIVSIERAIKSIKLRVKVFLEGPLQ